MNLEQNLELVRRAKNAIERGQLQKLLARLINPLERAASNPADAGAANEYQNALISFLDGTRKPVLNVFSPHDIQIMGEMDIAVASGINISRLVENITNDPSLLPSSKLGELRKISDRVGSVLSRAKKMEEVAAELRWDTVSGEPPNKEGFTAELAWYIPRSKVENSLNQLKSEIKDFEMLVSSAGAITGNPQYKIVYISASNFGFDIAAAKETVDLIVGAISWVAGHYEKIAKAVEIFSQIKLTPETIKSIEKDLGTDNDELLHLIASDALKAIAPDKTVDPETATKFSRSVSLAVHKLKDGFQIDAKYIVDQTNPDINDNGVESAARIADLVSKIEYLESALKHVPALPAPAPDLASSAGPAE